MITVRFPDGKRVSYPKATCAVYEESEGRQRIWILYTKKKGEWVASICPLPGMILESNDFVVKEN